MSAPTSSIAGYKLVNIHKQNQEVKTALDRNDIVSANSTEEKQGLDIPPPPYQNNESKIPKKREKGEKSSKKGRRWHCCPLSFLCF